MAAQPTNQLVAQLPNGQNLRIELIQSAAAPPCCNHPQCCFRTKTLEEEISEKEEAIKTRNTTIETTESAVKDKIAAVEEVKKKIEELQKELTQKTIEAGKKINELAALKNEQIADQGALDNLKTRESNERAALLQSSEVALQAYIAALPK